MNIISINHKNAPLEVRGKISFNDEEIIEFCHRLKEQYLVDECMIISTCNRTEIYYISKKSIETIQKEIANYKNLDNTKLLNYYRVYCDNMAIQHIFEVACGINSMILGEDEILHQMKHAFQLALDNKFTGYTLNTIIKEAISCAKKIKTQTKISKTAVSVGTLTANEIFNLDIDNKSVLIIGITGKIGSIIMKNLLAKDIKIIGTIRNHNSTFEYTSKYPNIEFVDYHERYRYINQVDVVISATSSPHYTITKDRLEQSLTTDKPRLFLDLAVPQDIDSSIKEISNITLKNIDYFNILSRQNNLEKLQEVEKAKIIISEEIETLLKEISIHEFIPYMDNLKQYVENYGVENLIFKIKSESDSQTFKNMLKYLKELIA
ncbi:MAG: glutamyl-tRNA reductase [Oscillospiraceae bacterium]